MSAVFESKWQPSVSQGPALPSIGVLSSHPLAVGKSKSLQECAPETLRRLTKWTSDQKAFSRAVLSYARVTPASNAYMLGNVRTGDGGFLDSGLGGRPDEAGVLKVPNPAHSFRLQWHRATLHEKVGDIKLPVEQMDELSKLHSIQSLYDICEIVSRDANFRAQPERYPNMVKLAKDLKI